MKDVLRACPARGVQQGVAATGDFTQREAVVTSPAERCNGAYRDCCWQPEPYTTDPVTKPV